jgi:hypothetical protein
LALKPCPNCRHQNPEENSYCGNCGSELRQSALIISRPSPIQISETPLATPQIKALAATIAVSAAAILAEQGLVYVQRRLSAIERPSFSLRRKKSKTEPGAVIVPHMAKKTRVITVVGERVIEEKHWGRPVRRVVERFAWRGEEQDNS